MSRFMPMSALPGRAWTARYIPVVADDKPGNCWMVSAKITLREQCDVADPPTHGPVPTSRCVTRTTASCGAASELVMLRQFCAAWSARKATTQMQHDKKECSRMARLHGHRTGHGRMSV